jgi:hypothetical protein
MVGFGGGLWWSGLVCEYMTVVPGRASPCSASGGHVPAACAAVAGRLALVGGGVGAGGT